jgi:hypothetical protein
MDTRWTQNIEKQRDTKRSGEQSNQCAFAGQRAFVQVTARRRATRAQNYDI